MTRDTRLLLDLLSKTPLQRACERFERQQEEYQKEMQRLSEIDDNRYPWHYVAWHVGRADPPASGIYRVPNVTILGSDL